jgi:hypothetical protein
MHGPLNVKFVWCFWCIPIPYRVYGVYRFITIIVRCRFFHFTFSCMAARIHNWLLVMNSETLHKNKIKQMAVIYRVFQKQSSSRNISKDMDSIRSSNNVLNKHLAEILSVSLP